ncbi:MAG: transporter substrate-binding domain-containing protein [Prevotella sp.]|nr:transporter substrate-binding domain-containing protein [Prevotella sp.]
MKRHAIAILLLLLAFMPAAKGQSLKSRYNSEHPVVIVCDWDKPPYEFLSDNGDPTGMNIDIIRAVMNGLELPCRFVMKEWTIAMKTFERGQADIILTNAHRFRGQDFAVSENIINYDRIQVALLGDSASTVTFRQLEREGVVFKPGDYSATYFLDGETDNITANIEFQSPKVALMGVANGDYKYYVWGEEPLKWKLKELNLTGITLSDVGIPISEIHFVGRDRQLIEEIDDQFSRLKQRGDLAQINTHWLHPEQEVPSSTPTTLIIIGAALLLAVVFYLLSRLTKAHVKSATRKFIELNDMMIKALHMGDFKIMEYDIAANRIVNRYGNILPEGGLTIEEFTARIHPDQQEEFRKKMQQLVNGRERKFDLDKRWNAGTADNPQWLDFHGHAISETDENGRPAYIINAIHDITHEVEEDEAMQNLTNHYDHLVNMPSLGISFYDKDGWLISINDSMKQLCGITDDNPEQMRFWESINMYDVNNFRNIYLSDEDGDTIVCQHLFLPEIGLDKYIELGVRPLYDNDGGLVNFLISAFDVTNERNDDREEHLLERKQRRVVNDIAVHKERLIYMLQESTRYIIRSDMKRQTIAFYRSPEIPEYEHTWKEFLSMLNAQESDALRNLLTDKSTRTTQTFILHLTNPALSPSTYTIRIHFTPMTDKQGNIVGHEGISSDISEQVNARKLLEEKKEEAEQSVNRKSGFMASMTHELRTPLNAIQGFSSVLLALSDEPGRSEYVRIVRNSSDMLQRLINDIIEASRISEGAPMVIRPKEVDFPMYFDDMCTALRQRVQNPNVEFSKDSPYEHFYTCIDTERIMQILTNFVTNAVKFTNKGHIRVGYKYTTIDSPDSGTKNSGPKPFGLYIYCEDTGIGIPKDKHSLIFNRFVKLDEFVQGTGMGLAICKSIAESFDGQIGVSSEGPQKGSTFWAWIPCERRLTPQES